MDEFLLVLIFHHFISFLLWCNRLSVRNKIWMGRTEKRTTKTANMKLLLLYWWLLAAILSTLRRNICPHSIPFRLIYLFISEQNFSVVMRCKYNRQNNFIQNTFYEIFWLLRPLPKSSLCLPKIVLCSTRSTVTRKENYINNWINQEKKRRARDDFISFYVRWIEPCTTEKVVSLAVEWWNLVFLFLRVFCLKIQIEQLQFLSKILRFFRKLLLWHSSSLLILPRSIFILDTLFVLSLSMSLAQWKKFVLSIVPKCEKSGKSKSVAREKAVRRRRKN